MFQSFDGYFSYFRSELSLFYEIRYLFCMVKVNERPGVSTNKNNNIFESLKSKLRNKIKDKSIIIYFDV